MQVTQYYMYNRSKHHATVKPTVIHTGTTRARYGSDVVVMWSGLVKRVRKLPYLPQSYTGTTHTPINPDP